MKKLYEDFEKYQEIINKFDENDGILDISDETFLAPTTVCALKCFIEDNNVVKIKSNPKLKKVLKNILNDEEISEKTPFVKLPFSRKEWFESEEIFEFVDKLNSEKYLGFHSSFFITNELITNIYDHSTIFKDEINKGFVFAFEYSNENILDVCFVDNGLSIPNKFEIKDIDFKDDCDAIYKATQQFSTENSPELGLYDRGIGLWATLKLTIKGNDGNALIVSRNGLLEINSSESFKYELLNNMFKGTLVCLRFKDNQIQNFYDLIEMYDNFDFKYEV